MTTNLPATLDDIAKVIAAANAGDVIAHRLTMLAMRMPCGKSERWNKAAKAAAVDWLEQAAGMFEDVLKTNSAEWLEENAPTTLCNGSLPLDWELKVIQAAEAGDHVAHNSLVKAYWEMRRAGKTPSSFVESYVGRAQMETPPPPRRKRGKHTPHDHLHRNLTFMNLMVLACLRFGVEPTRNRELKLAGHPCAASLVRLAVRRRRILVSESRLANIWSEGGCEGRSLDSELHFLAG